MPSDWVVVMAQGAIIAEGPPRAVAKDPAVIEAYLGAEHGDESRFTPVPRGPATRGSAPADGEVTP